MSGLKHPLNRLSLSLFVVSSSIYLALTALGFSPASIEQLDLHCSESNVADKTRTHRENPPGFLLLSWDVSALNLGGESRLSEETLIKTLKQSMTRALKKKNRGIFIALQGLPFTWRHRLSALLTDRGGCWSYAPIWRTPSWLITVGITRLPSWFDRWLSHRSVEEYSTSSLQEYGLWSAVIGVDPNQVKSAERWGMIPEPGRWPKRIFHPQPAALALRLSKVQLINLKLPDTTHKHQAGALSLQKLKTPPLSDRLNQPWVIIGDWRVNPPNTPPHPEVGYRFQRFSLDELQSSRPALFEANMNSERWGRWRKNAQSIPSVIDLAYSSEGTLTPKDNTQTLHWLNGLTEQRALLVADWVL